MQSIYAEMASTGQELTQTPQSMQVSALISYCESPAVMASTGHSPEQAPQDTHSLLILCAMIIPPFAFLAYLFYLSGYA